MKKADINNLKLGKADIYWKSGGSSSACIANSHDGRKVMLCANWTGKTPADIAVFMDEYSKQIKDVVSLE